MRNLKFLLSCFMLLMSVVAFAQNQVTGHVADATGEPIIGAHVSERGTRSKGNRRPHARVLFLQGQLRQVRFATDPVRGVFAIEKGNRRGGLLWW